jgi:hypothetical protein
MSLVTQFSGELCSQISWYYGTVQKPLLGLPHTLQVRECPT